MNALELQGLTKHYKDFTLGPLDLTLPGGTICGLIGENGAGKSTTIRLILDMVQRDGGTVTILGRDSRTVSVRTKEEIGVVLGSDGIPLCLNAVEVGKVMAGIYRNWDAGDYTAFCRKFDLPPDKKYKDYSAGMQRKLCIAVALSHHAKLLLLDEATNGLDPVVRDEVTDMLLDFARDEEHSILISSHIVSDLEKLCDTIAFLHKGRLLLCEEKRCSARGIRLVARHGGAAGGIGCAGVRQAGHPLRGRGACAPGRNARRSRACPGKH